MKKILFIFVIALLAVVKSFAQSKPIRGIGTKDDIAKVNGILMVDSGFILPTFQDTMPSRFGYTNIRNGFLMRTVSPNGAWFRDSTAKKWLPVQFTTSSITTDTLRVRWPLYGLSGGGVNPDTLLIHVFTNTGDSGYVTQTLWNTKLNVSDTVNRTVRLFPGTNVTITGTFPNYTINSSGGGGGGSYTASQSITLSGSNFTLTNDNATPGNNYAYGTNSSGTKGFNKMAVIDTAGIADGSFTYYDNASGTWKMLAPVANKNLRWNGTAWVYKDTTAIGGGGSPNTSVGSGFRVAINGTNNIKSLTGGIDMLLDSTTSNQVNISADTTTGTTKLATQGDIDRGIAAVGLKQVTAINDSAINRIITNDTLKGADVVIHQKNIVGDATASGKAMTVYGTSIADINPPTNVTVAQNYVTGVSQGLGFNLIDRAKAGSTTMQYSAGDSSVENKIYTIPTKTSAHGLLLLDAPGLNDFYVPFGHAFDTVALKAMLNKWLDTAHTARGWSYDSIVFVSAPYTTSTQYPHAHDANRAARTVCESRGVMFVDMETFMQARSGYFSPGDTIHSNSVGHQFYTANILKSLPNFKKVGFLNVHGGSQIEDSLYVKNLLRIGDFTPTYLPSSYKAIIGGDLDVFGIIRNGNQTSDLHSAKVQIETSIGVPAFSTKDGSGTADLYVPYLQLTNSGSTIKYGSSYTDINAVSGYYTYIGGSGLKVLELGPSTGAIFNGDKYTGGILQAKGTGSAYLFFTTPPLDRVGIKDSLPQQTHSVRGSGFYLDTLIMAGKVKMSGIPNAAGSKVLHWDPSTNMVSWADTTTSGGSGEVNTASNLGVTTYGLYKTKVGVDLQFKSLTAGTGISLTSNTNDVQIGVNIDTTNISSFAAKVRSLFTVTSPVVYNSATGLLSLDTASGKWRSENYYNTKFASIGANVNTSVGSGYKVAVNGTNNVKSLTNLYAIYFDSTSTTVSIGVDTSDGNTNIATQGDVARSVDTTKKWLPLSYIDTKYFDSTGKSFKLRNDTCTLASFDVGMGLASDTALFSSTSNIFGAFYWRGSDTIKVTGLDIGLQGTSPNVTITVYYNDSLGVTAGATKLVNAGNAATNIYTGTSVSSFDNSKIPPGNWVWVQASTIATKPKKLTVSLTGYKIPR